MWNLKIYIYIVYQVFEIHSVMKNCLVHLSHLFTICLFQCTKKWKLAQNIWAVKDNWVLLIQLFAIFIRPVLAVCINRVWTVAESIAKRHALTSSESAPTAHRPLQMSGSLKYIWSQQLHVSISFWDTLTSEISTFSLMFSWSKNLRFSTELVNVLVNTRIITFLSIQGFFCASSEFVVINNIT